jgi:hypothetical protein
MLRLQGAVLDLPRLDRDRTLKLIALIRKGGKLALSVGNGYRGVLFEQGNGMAAS